jgi:hypothetical protein
LQQSSRKISTLNEKPLHEALKKWYGQPNDRFEQSVDGFIIDIVRGDLLVEIQTRNFGALRRKLKKLLVQHPIRLVYPIPAEKWIIKQEDLGNNRASRRRSPKRGSFIHVFEELVSIPELLVDPNFSLELLLIEEEELRTFDGNRAWRRRGWVTQERRLVRVIERLVLQRPADLGALFPSALAEPFTTADIAAAISRPRRLAQKMVYCLRLTGCIKIVGKRSNAILYARTITWSPTA